MASTYIQRTLKILVIGDEESGKSSLLNAISSTVNKRTIKPQPTRAAVFEVLNDPINSIRYQFWDTSGQEKYVPSTIPYFRGSHSNYVCLDMTKTEDEIRNSAKKWVMLANRHSALGTPITLIGTKWDLISSEDQLASKQAFLKTLAQELNVLSSKFNQSANQIANLSEEEHSTTVTNFLKSTPVVSDSAVTRQSHHPYSEAKTNIIKQVQDQMDRIKGTWGVLLKSDSTKVSALSVLIKRLQSATDDNLVTIITDWEKLNKNIIKQHRGRFTLFPESETTTQIMIKSITKDAQAILSKPATYSPLKGHDGSDKG